MVAWLSMSGYAPGWISSNSASSVAKTGPAHDASTTVHNATFLIRPSHNRKLLLSFLDVIRAASQLKFPTTGVLRCANDRIDQVSPMARLAIAAHVGRAHTVQVAQGVGPRVGNLTHFRGLRVFELAGERRESGVIEFRGELDPRIPGQVIPRRRLAEQVHAPDDRLAV